MSEQVTAKGLTAKEKTALFWASFLSLVAAGVGFVISIHHLALGLLVRRHQGDAQGRHREPRQRIAEQ